MFDSRMLAGITLLALVTGPVIAADPPAGPKNVLLLIADDLYRDISVYGNPRMPTPNLERLAASGVRFDLAFATVASCSPSRSVLFTGQHNHTNGMYGLAHAEHHFSSLDRVQSLPALLKQKGYVTAIIGKEHVTPSTVYPFEKRINDRIAGARDVGAIADRAREFLAEVKNQPFLLVVGYTDPHRAARGYANERSYAGIKPVVFDSKDVAVPFFLPDQPEVRADIAEYCQSISRLDQGVGLMLNLLQETGRDKDTLVIFLSDNGMPFPGAKTTLYDPGVHLPLLISSPAQKKRGLVNQAMVSWVDIAPTILDWAGVKSAQPLPGRSLLPILEEPEGRGWDKVYLSHTFHEVTMYYPIRGVRTRQFKYLWNLAHDSPFPPAGDLFGSPTYQGILKRNDDRMGERAFSAYLRRPAEELYDLTKDPHELKNLAGDPAYAKVLDQLRQDVRNFQKTTNDPWIVRQQY